MVCRQRLDHFIPNGTFTVGRGNRSLFVMGQTNLIVNSGKIGFSISLFLYETLRQLHNFLGLFRNSLAYHTKAIRPTVLELGKHSPL